MVITFFKKLIVEYRAMEAIAQDMARIAANSNYHIKSAL
jgi:hypothetical protein